MDTKTFTSCMDRMGDHFNKHLKDPRHYWEALERLPDDAFQDICKQRIWGGTPNPSNFPTIQGLMDDYQMWLKKNPHRQEIVRWEFCGLCESASPGLIEVKIPLEEAMYPNSEHNFRQTIVRCGHCNNAKHRNPTFPKYRREEMDAKGWGIVTKIHKLEEEEDVRAPLQPPPKPRGGVTHIEQSLPLGDRDDQIPF